MKSLQTYITEFTVNGTTSDKILIFDVDDTLIHTTAQILVRRGKDVRKISNQEFNTYKLKKGESFDFSEFDDYKLLDSEEMTPYWDTLKREYRRGAHIGIITARGSVDIIYIFLAKKGIRVKRDLIFATGDPLLGLSGNVQQRKAQAVEILTGRGYNKFVFFDDNEDNLKEVKKLEKDLPIKVITVKV